MDMTTFKQIGIGEVFTIAVPIGKNIWKKSNTLLVKINKDNAAVLFFPNKRDFVPDNTDIILNT